MLRLLHTSDWHLGHTLHGLPRGYEHRQFLTWLLDTIEHKSIDALLLAGDVFDQASPRMTAVAMWFDFLATARQRCPNLDIVIIAGNHDSPARLDAPRSLLVPFGVRVVGAMRTEVNELVVPIRDRDGRVAAQVVAVPFLRPGDVLGPERPSEPSVESLAVDPLIEGVRAVYSHAIEAARGQRTGNQALVAMGHCYMIGTELSQRSERRILGGNQHALPVSIFPDDVAYVALGHLHRPQCVGMREHVRYSGSPVPLAMNEAWYRHQVVVVELDGCEVASIEPVTVPRVVDLLRVPAQGSEPVSDVLQALAALPVRDGCVAEHQRPFLEVRVALRSPRPSLRTDIEDALADKAARLVRIEVQYTGDTRALGDVTAEETSLVELAPHDVFKRRYARDYATQPPSALLDAFDALLDQVRQRTG